MAIRGQFQLSGEELSMARNDHRLIPDVSSVRAAPGTQGGLEHAQYDPWRIPGSPPPV